MNALKKGVKITKKSKPKKSDKILLSVVIPCHNCKETIERLLDSLVQQINPPRFEVIIQDDYSTDNFMEIVNKYKKSLDIKYFLNEKREIHCPSNTRLDGMKHISGEWVTFIDHDDIFEINAFSEFAQCLEKTHEQVLIASNFRYYYIDQNKYGKEFIQTNTSTWLHGKFYNVKYLTDRNITFKENILSNEDLYFNQCILAHIAAEKINYTMLNVFTYKWVYNDDSLSRAMFKDEEFYIDKYFDEYLEAATQPWIDIATNRSDMGKTAFIRVCYIALYGYFYYQSLYYRRGCKHHRKNRDIYENFINKIKTDFAAENSDIIDFIYSNDAIYNKIREDCFGGCVHLIETESFKDFINRF